MRARLIIILALCSFGGAWFRPERARADDFDDDFGVLPATRAPVAATPSAATPSAEPAARETTAYPPLDDDPALSPSPRADAHRKRTSFVHPTIEGLVGGVHVIDGSSAKPGTFRVALNGGFFRKNGFTAHDDHHRSVSSDLVLDVTPIDHLELAASLATRSSENRTMEPHVVQVVGDMHFFAKTFWSVLPWLTVAGDAELALLNGVGSIGLLGGATSVGLRASATADLRTLEHKPLPIILRSNLRYLFDNSGRLGRAIEHDRYVSLNSSGPRADEYRQFLSPAERSALQIDRVDNIGASFGVEVPLLPHQRVHVSPLLEWSFALPVNRQGFDCVQTNIAGQRDGCLAKTGFAARPSTLTLGARAEAWVEGLAVLFAVDVATTGSRTFVRELAPLDRYVVRLGVSYAYDPQKAPPARRIQRIALAAPAARGHVLGEVREQQTGAPIAGAVLHFEGTELSDVLSNAAGAFKSAELPAGVVTMQVHADGFLDAPCSAIMPSTGLDVVAHCELTPSAYYGSLDGRVTDRAGAVVAGAHLALSGASELSLTSKKDGSFHSDKLLEGDYQLVATAPGYFERSISLRVGRGAEAAPNVALLARPPRALVRLTRPRIVTTRPIMFADDTAIIADESQSMLGELAELLRKHSELTHVSIEGHVDDKLNAAAALALSEQRAEAVRAWLVDAGVESARLGVKGFGSTRPVVPNITKNNRTRNRRIELLLK
ncbi:MAG: OmpA/MotB domain protein [Myxococcaceae bacterium]|nr:OmpA/MotB domain protein [Myxococcaceae bacterium]